jgi:hypothetical protein
MITVTFEYHCDFCEAEIRKPQKTRLMHADVLPLPDRATSILHSAMLCGECADRAQKGLERRE